MQNSFVNNVEWTLNINPSSIGFGRFNIRVNHNIMSCSQNF